MHYLIDIIQSHNLAAKLHPIGAWIVLMFGGLITGLHVTAAVLSIIYTIICIFAKLEERKRNNQTPKTPEP